MHETRTVALTASVEIVKTKRGEEDVGGGDLVSPSELAVLGLHRAPNAADTTLLGVLPDEGGVGLAT